MRVCVSESRRSVAEAEGIREAVVVGDKTGDVWGLPLPSLSMTTLLMGHTASMITALAVLPPTNDGAPGLAGSWQIASADRDEKIRLSRWPATACTTAFCLGHTEFLSCLTLLRPLPPAAAAGANGAGGEAVSLLVSGSGDGTVRLWTTSGEQIACCRAEDQPPGEEDGQGAAGAAEPGEAQQAAPRCFPVDLSVSPDGQTVAVAVSGRPVVLIYRLDWASSSSSSSSASSSSSGASNGTASISSESGETEGPRPHLVLSESIEIAAPAEAVCFTSGSSGSGFSPPQLFALAAAPNYLLRVPLTASSSSSAQEDKDPAALRLAAEVAQVSPALAVVDPRQADMPT